MRIKNKIQETNLNLYCCMYPDCPNEYTSKFNLKRHVESVHMHVKKFQCSVCQVFFSSRQSLKEHLHIHSGVMPFKCNTCERYFRQASQLCLHLRIHIAEGLEVDYAKVKVEERLAEIKPIGVCMTVDEEKFRLPGIESLRVCRVQLPLLDALLY